MQPLDMGFGDVAPPLLYALLESALESLELCVAGGGHGPRLAASERGHGEQGLRGGQDVEAQRGEVEAEEVKVEEVGVRDA